jgi:hypothetical protein
LTIPVTELDDSGEYRCEAENEYGSAWTEGPIIVATEGQLPIDGEAPDFSQPVRPVTVMEGETAVLEGKVTGIPRPDIKWYTSISGILPLYSSTIATRTSSQQTSQHSSDAPVSSITSDIHAANFL